MSIVVTKSTLNEFTTTELLTWFNAHSGEEPVKRFSDRASAERRVVAVLEKGKSSPSALKAPKAPRAPKQRKERATPEQRSKAVKDSWDDKGVRAARSARHNVRVDGTLHDSVLKAFVALKLNTKAHQRVRREVVAHGKTEFEGHKFVLAPKED